MDYFELFKLPMSFRIELTQLQKRYYQLCREHHPDHAANGDEMAKNNAEKMLSEINEAKKILESEDLRIAYILQVKGVIIPDEKFQLPAVFLAEMMDLNETLMEWEMNPVGDLKIQISEELDFIKRKSKAEINPIFDANFDSLAAKDFEMLKAYYYKQKYLNRIAEKL